MSTESSSESESESKSKSADTPTAAAPAPARPTFSPRLLAALQQPRRCPSNFSEHVFKIVKGHELQCRIWPAQNLAPGKKAPWVIWTHGGGWASGNHLAPPQWYRRGFIERGYHLFTHSYRLTPQASAEEMLEDCLDAVAWARKNIGRIVGEEKVEVTDLVVSGDSAGGQLCMLTAHHLSPPPKVVVGIYPVVDFPRMLAEELPIGAWKGRWPEAELKVALEDREDYCSVALFEREHHRFPVEELRKRWQAPWLTYDERRLLQSSIMEYLALKVALQTTLLRKSAFTSQEEFMAYAASVSPLQVLGERKTYPPTVLLSGTADFVEQSESFAEKLRELGIDVLESYEEGSPHVFDQIYHDESVDGWGEVIEPVLKFVAKYVGK